MFKLKTLENAVVNILRFEKVFLKFYLIKLFIQVAIEKKKNV